MSIELIENPHGFIRPGHIDGSGIGWNCSWRSYKGWALTKKGAKRKVLAWMRENS